MTAFHQLAHQAFLGGLLALAAVLVWLTHADRRGSGRP
jgi:hypothetical protein